MSWFYNMIIAAFYLCSIIGIALLIRVIAAWRDHANEKRREQR